ncbi:hypothetical protein ACGK9R_17125 [Halomonas sp. HNIBRBA4712]|uniref:hypothetical protein n=1 Tax=Halomonas sp. HNIBRBA4712 TaxID=3373087 RepID=UPI0037469D2D
MMDRNKVKKVKFFYRFLCGFIVSVCLFSIIGIVVMLFEEGIDLRILFFSLAVGVMLHVSASVMLTGYPPKYLRWTSGHE